MNNRHPRLIGGDRNARALREHHHKQFVERVGAGLVHPQDRYAKPLKVDDLVQWQPAFQPVCQIVEINVMPRKMQPPEGSCRVEVVLALSAPVPLDVTQPTPILARVKDASGANALAAAEARIVALTQEIAQLTAGGADPPQVPEDPDDTPDSSTS